MASFNIFNGDRLTALAVKMRRGNRKAAEALYDELGAKAYGFFFTRVGKKEIAEDLSQDLFARLIEKIEMFDEGKGAFAVWFWQMARHMLIDYYRSKKEMPFSMFEEEEVEALAVAEMPNMDDRLSYRKLQEFLRELAEEERDIFELRYVAGVPYKEMSGILEKSEGALRVAAMRLKAKIKKEFNHEF